MCSTHVYRRTHTPVVSKHKHTYTHVEAFGLRNLQYSHMRLSLPANATFADTFACSLLFYTVRVFSQRYLCAHIGVQWHGLMFTSTNVQFSKCMPKVFSNQLLSPFLFLSVWLCFAFFLPFTVLSLEHRVHMRDVVCIWLAICQGEIWLLKNLYAIAFK